MTDPLLPSPSDSPETPQPLPGAAGAGTPESAIAASPTLPAAANQSDFANLPPVEPPSAGFIAQLFLVPALIVAVVIGLYLLFGRMATQDANWRQVLANVKSPNPHVRWTNALTLAQLLDADRAKGERSEKLTANPEIATGLSELFLEAIKPANPNEQQVEQVKFLATALGRMDAPDIVYPALLQGADSGRHQDIRLQALTGMMLAAGGSFERQAPTDRADVRSRILIDSRDEAPVVRHIATYILGLLPGSESQSRLSELLSDADFKTRINAAIALTRSGSTSGVDVFCEVLGAAPSWTWDQPAPGAAPSDALSPNEQAAILNNVLLAIEDLNQTWSPADRDRLQRLIEPLQQSAELVALRVAAGKALQSLKPPLP